MKFIGCNPIKPFEPTIEIYMDQKAWDLHNDGEFIGFSFDVKKRNATFIWKYYVDDKDIKSFHHIKIIFNGITTFEVIKRDHEMPYSEDDCIENIIYDNRQESIIMKFMGGQEINIGSEELIFQHVK